MGSGRRGENQAGRQDAHLSPRSGSAANSLCTASWLPSFLLRERRGLAPTTSKVPNASKNNAYLVSLMLGLGHHSPALWLPQGPVGWSGPKEGQVLRMQALFLQVKSQRLHRAQIHPSSEQQEGAWRLLWPLFPLQLNCCKDQGITGGPGKT